MAIEQSGSTEQSTRASPSRAVRQDPDAASETSSAHSGDPSDRRDADILTQVFSARSEEYRLLFRLPPDEVLVQDFNCALQENILLQGHMYLFIHHVCFYSNIFGFETKKTISFHEVTCVRKAKTAAIFPNAIEIVAGGKKHFFGSFLSRDEAYRLIIDGWAQHSSEAKAFLDRQEVKSDANTQDNALVMSERVMGSKEPTEDSSSPDRYKNTHISEECKPSSNGKNDVNVPDKLSEVQENRENGCSLSPGGPLSWQIEDADAPNIPDHFTMVAEGKLPVRVDDFFKLFFSDCASEFVQNFHRKCGDKDFRCTPWRDHKQFGHARDVSFLHPVKIYIGAKFGNCQEIQKFRVYRNSHLVIETSQQISDVPYGDYFHVEGIWDVKQDHNEGNSCTLQVYSNVAFSKKTMFKGKIEQSTRDECREVYGFWINNARELLKQKSVGLLEGDSGQITGMIHYNSVGLERSLEVEEPSEQLNSTMTPKIPQSVSGTIIFNPQLDNSTQENLGYSLSLASIFTKSWTTFVSDIISQRHFSLFLVVAFAAIVILSQMSIIVLLTRVPEVHLVTPGNYVSSPGSYRLENIEWLEKRFNYLKEEMLMVETRMERMHHEYAVLKAHLQSLEQLKPKS